MSHATYEHQTNMAAANESPLTPSAEALDKGAGRGDMVSPLFLFVAGSVAPDQLEKLKVAGYLAIEVKSFDDVKLLYPIPVAQIGAISRAAFATLANAGVGSSLPDAFGRRVAKALAG